MGRAKAQPPRLLRGGLSGRVYVATRYRDLGNGTWEALEKHDVHEDFLAMVAELNQPVGSWATDQTPPRPPAPPAPPPPAPPLGHVVYTCPNCGHDGPHPLVEAAAPGRPGTLECRGCHAEVEVAH